MLYQYFAAKASFGQAAIPARVPSNHRFRVTDTRNRNQQALERPAGLVGLPFVNRPTPR